MEESKNLDTSTKQDYAEQYSGITIDTTNDERSDEKQAKDWTKMINNNANSSPLYNPPEEETNQSK